MPKHVDKGVERRYNRYKTLAKVLAILGNKRKQMKNCSKHYQTISKQGGFMPSVWFASSNDRTPEICPGSQETLV